MLSYQGMVVFVHKETGIIRELLQMVSYQSVVFVDNRKTMVLMVVFVNKMTSYDRL
jgi:hypothetical protein